LLTLLAVLSACLGCTDSNSLAPSNVPWSAENVEVEANHLHFCDVLPDGERAILYGFRIHDDGSQPATISALELVSVDGLQVDEVALLGVDEAALVDNVPPRGIREEKWDARPILGRDELRIEAKDTVRLMFQVGLLPGYESGEARDVRVRYQVEGRSYVTETTSLRLTIMSEGVCD
jgi:hypothetical protein